MHFKKQKQIEKKAVLIHKHFQLTTSVSQDIVQATKKEDSNPDSNSYKVLSPCCTCHEQVIVP